jgi:hypothetical protein
MIGNVTIFSSPQERELFNIKAQFFFQIKQPNEETLCSILQCCKPKLERQRLCEFHYNFCHNPISEHSNDDFQELNYEI